MVANSVIDVMLGEAGGRTEAERYADMVAIASVIQNRATLSGLTPKSVVSVRSEFNAYGKSLPNGVEAYRDLAEQAWNQVQTTGPVHNATYYATPKAKEGLPDGLTPVTETEGHEFFADPKGRSFRTAEGYVTPATDKHAAMMSGNLVAPQNPYSGLVPPTPVQTVSLPQTAPAPVARADIPSAPGRTITPGAGLANLTPNARGTPVASYDTSALAPSTQGLVNALDRAGFGQVGVNSGYRSPSRNQRVGGASRSQHLTGRAIDLATAQMPEAQRASLLEAGIVKGNAKGIGLYPSGNIHMDTRATPTVWGPGRSAYAGVGIDQVPAYARDIIGDMLNAGPYGVTPRTNPPTPTARPDTVSSLPAAPVTPVERATLPDIGVSPVAMSADARATAGAGLRGSGTLSVAPPPAPTQQVSLPDFAPVPSARPTLDTAIAAPPAAPPMADNTPVQSGFPPAPGFPAPPPAPGRKARTEAAKGAVLGGLKGGPVGALLGGLIGPGMAQIRGNIASNRLGIGSRINPFTGFRGAYRGMFGNSRLGGLLSPPTYASPYSVGSGYSAIGSTFGGPSGATAYSRSNPAISFTSLGNGLVSRTNRDTGVTYTMSSSDYDAGPSRSSSKSKSK